MTDQHNPEPDDTQDQSESPEGESRFESVAEKVAIITGIVMLVVILCCCGGLVVNYIIAGG